MLIMTYWVVGKELSGNSPSSPRVIFDLNSSPGTEKVLKILYPALSRLAISFGVL